jgi:hypothetical protein
VKRVVAVSAPLVAGCLLARSTAGAIIQLDRGIAGARLGND